MKHSFISLRTILDSIASEIVLDKNALSAAFKWREEEPIPSIFRPAARLIENRRRLETSLLEAAAMHAFRKSIAAGAFDAALANSKNGPEWYDTGDTGWRKRSQSAREESLAILVKIACSARAFADQTIRLGSVVSADCTKAQPPTQNESIRLDEIELETNEVISFLDENGISHSLKSDKGAITPCNPSNLQHSSLIKNGSAEGISASECIPQTPQSSRHTSEGSFTSLEGINTSNHDGREKEYELQKAEEEQSAAPTAGGEAFYTPELWSSKVHPTNPPTLLLLKLLKQVEVENPGLKTSNRADYSIIRISFLEALYKITNSQDSTSGITRGKNKLFSIRDSSSPGGRIELSEKAVLDRVFPQRRGLGKKN